MEASILCLMDTKGRPMWIAQRRGHLECFVTDLRKRGERYRIVSRQISALGGTVEVFCLVILGKKGGNDG